jgi:hypothetical protein
MAKEEMSAEVLKALNESTSSDEIRDILHNQPRDEKGQFVSTKAAEPEKKVDPPAPVVVKETFLIGGKEVEFEADSPEHLLSMVKTATQAYEMGKPKPEPPKVEPPKPAFTADELAALSIRMSQGDPSALEEFIEKGGVVDKILEKRGIKPEELKKVMEQDRSNDFQRRFDTARDEFLKSSDWPGGTRNGKLMGYKLVELGLADNPSKDNFQKAYDALKAEGLLDARVEETTTTTTTTETKTEPVKAAVAATTQTTTTPPKKAATGSTMFGSSQESGTRRTAATGPQKTPEIPPDATPQQIMDMWKQGIQAEGKNPDEALRDTYAARRA